ncbi:MAG: HNH endonuclease signature motif containing protein [Sarcina sp.]
MKNVVYNGTTFSKYFIDNKGNILNSEKDKLKPWDDGRGYLVVDITNDKGESIRTKIHNAVAETFHGKRPKNAIVQHKDANKHNNAPSNIEYLSQKENVAHAQVEVKGKEYLSDKQLDTIKAKLKVMGIKEVSEEMNIAYHIIRDIKNGKTYK